MPCRVGSRELAELVESIEGERPTASALVLVADRSRGLPLVATNPAAYADPSFHAAHDAMLCIAHSAYVEEAERVRSSSEAWLKDPAARAPVAAK